MICQTKAGKRQHDKLVKRIGEIEDTKAKRWLHGCGRKDFSRISDIKMTPIFACSILLGRMGPQMRIQTL